MPSGIYEHKPLSEKHKRHIREAKKGCIPWNKGLNKGIDKRLGKMSETLKANPLRNRLGKNHTEDAKRKISESKRGVPIPKKIVNLRGQRFGRLQVIEPMGRDKSKSVIWSCECDCGKLVMVVSRALIHNGQRSCGCLKKSRSMGKRISEAQRKIHHSISLMIYKALKGRKNGHHWENLVGYTVLELMAHLERQFEPGMSWDNHSRNGWHVDHIIPQSVFNYTSPEHIDFKRCWALENLQPLWKKENLIKHAKIREPFQPSLAL